MWGRLLLISCMEEEPEGQREPEVSQRFRAWLSQEPPGSYPCSLDAWLGPGRAGGGGHIPTGLALGTGSLRLHPGSAGLPRAGQADLLLSQSQG